ncbi:MAG: hypothetical protein R3246_03790 [Acidimicrobiia bacterium]|nr:hypothetical protein [Acidimicrobiia bacterium]
MTRRIVALLSIAMLVAACSPEEAELTTTTTTVSETTSTTEAEDTTTTTEAEDDSDAGPDGPAISEYEVVVRSSGSGGEALWVLIDPGDYTDIDLENFIRELVDESDVALAQIHVFDDLDALEAGRIDSEARTDDEQALVDAHYLVSLIDGSTIRFQGPYADLGETAVGS